MKISETQKKQRCNNLFSSTEQQASNCLVQPVYCCYSNNYLLLVVVNYSFVHSVSTVVTNSLFTFKFNKRRSNQKKMVAFCPRLLQEVVCFSLSKRLFPQLYICSSFLQRKSSRGVHHCACAKAGKALGKEKKIQ